MEPRLQERIANEILRMTALRGGGKSLCPSEVARSLEEKDGSCREESWRPLMPQIREVAMDLASQGRIAVTQKGKPVSCREPRGPIRLAAMDGKGEE